MNQHDNPHHPGNPDHQSYSDFPPQKERMSCWAVGCIGLFAAFILLGLLYVAVVPYFTSGVRDAKQLEGKYMMKALRNSALAAYEKMGTPPRTLTGSLEEGGAEVETTMLWGKYYYIEDRIGAPRDGYGSLTANPKSTASGEPIGTMTFSWDTGESEIEWSR
jgi:type II secretory pathway pseudopilin PulG